MATIRVSERGTFKRCRRRWDYSSPSRKNLTTKRGPITLRFGTMVHSTLERWCENLKADPVILFMDVATEHHDELKEQYKRMVGAEVSEKELGEFYDHVELGRAMIDNYNQKWGSPVPEGYEVVQIEQMFHAQIPGTDHVLQGTFDGVLRNKLDNKLYILERKTYGARPRQEILDSNDQFLAYIWALQKLAADSGAEVGGILYDGLWKRTAERKRTLDDLFLRIVLTRPVHEVKEFERLLVEEVADMTDPNVRVYLNRQWLGCFDCPFDPLCTAESKGVNYNHILKTRYQTAELVVEEEEDHNDYTP